MSIRYCDWTNGYDFAVKRDRTTAIIAWSSGTTYALDDIVHDNVATPNRKVYKSIQAANLNNALSDAAWWVLIADGTNTLPYQSITDASTTLTGGDEVRCAKSPADTALTGTITFTLNSTTITGSSTLFTTELVVGDFVKGADNEYYEVITLTSATSAVLYQKYPSATTSGVTSAKLGITSTGASAASGTVIQAVSASGTSSGSKLKISGGWDLGTTTQTGQTYFRQMHGTFANRYGYGLQATSKNYLEYDKVNFLRYNRGMDVSSVTYLTITSAQCLSNQSGIYSINSSNNTITTATCNSNATYGIYFSNSHTSTITTATCNSNISAGIAISSSNTNTVTTATCNLNGNYGIFLSGTSNTITTATCNSNTYGLYFSSSTNNTTTTATCNTNSNTGIYFTNSSSNTITTATCNTNSSYGIYFSNSSSNTITTATCNTNSSYGIYFSNSTNTIADLTINSNITNGFLIFAANGSNVIYKLAGTGNIGTTYSSVIYTQFPVISIQDNNGGGSKNYFTSGETYSDTTDARTGTCLKYDVNSATDWMTHIFKMKVTTGTAYTVTFYLKKDASFSGDIEASVWSMGKEVVAYADKEPTGTGSYEAKTISIDTDDILAAGIAELRVRARGTAGNCFIDDISIS